MTRREFLRTTGRGVAKTAVGIAGASAFLKTAGLGERNASAGEVTRHRTYINGEQITNLPGGVRMGAEHHGLKEAWVYLHEDIYDEYWNNSGHEAARKIIGASKGSVSGIKVPDRIWNFSHVGFLIARKLGAVHSDFVPEDNPSLRFYADGLKYLYDKKNYWAREEFAKGIFSASELTNNDYERMRRAGVSVNYDRGKNVQGNAIVLAKRFENASLREKELILNTGIWEKFKNVSAPNKKQMENYHCEEYKLKSLYWNLGMFMRVGYKIPDSTAIELYDNKNSIYHILKEKLGYPVCTTRLVK
jgi:hypothetical protein